MRSCKFFILPLALASCTCLTATAQRMMGVSTSDWNSANSMYLNPSSMVGGHEKKVISATTFSFGVDNSLGTFSKLGDLFKFDGSAAFKTSDKKTFNMMLPYFEWRLPGFMMSLNGKNKHTFAFNTRMRAFNQFNSFDQSLYKTVVDPSSISTGTYRFTASNFNWTAHVWREYALSYGLVVLDKGKSLLKVGATGRYLSGTVYLGMKGKNVDVTFTTGNDSFSATNSDVQFASNIISAGSSFTDGLDVGSLAGKFFGFGGANGFSMDLGATYYFRGPDGVDKSKPENDYMFKASLAVTDLGGITYKQGKNYVMDVRGNGFLTSKGLMDNIAKSASLKNYLKGQGYSADTSSAKRKLSMPTTIVMGGDYHIKSKFFVNATYIMNLVDRLKFGNSYYNQLIVTPRFDSKLITAALPITYSALAGDLKLGLGFRVSGFFFGSDDMMALFSDNQYGFGFYIGSFVPLYRDKKKKSENK